VKGGDAQDDRSRRVGAADGFERVTDVALREVGGLGGDDHDVCLGIEGGDVAGRVVTRLIEAARVEER
jgi:hypothetical protein